MAGSLIKNVTDFTRYLGTKFLLGGAAEEGNREGNRAGLESGIGQGIEGGSGENFIGFWRGEKVASISADKDLA